MRKIIVITGSLVLLTAICFADSYDSLSKKLCKGALKLKSKKIAVMSFSHHDGGYSSGSKAVSERLITRIAQEKDIQVIERSLLDKVMNEMKLESTGMIDTETTKKIGKVLGVDAIVTGTLIDLKDEQTEV
ncbi:MAG: CsgG/HfaB family protein, partial [Elusimicrobiota bacterium]